MLGCGSMPVFVDEEAARLIRSGALHVYAQHVVHSDARDGEWVKVYHGDEFLGVGMFSERSSIPVKIFFREDADVTRIFDRLQVLFKRKRRIYPNTFRWVFAEGDLLPGLIMDKFEDVVVVRYTISGWGRLLEDLASFLQNYVNTAYLKNEGGREVMAERRYLFGSKRFVEIVEGKARFLVDIVEGQKTGFYLDQRENRLFFSKLAEGNILDLFSYTGAFGIHAALNGADVTFVELGKRNIQLLKKNLELNDVSGRVVRGDAVEFLRKTKEKFDTIVVDPPALAKRRRDIEDAKRYYFLLNRLGIRHLKDGGLLVSCSCTHFLTPKDFLGIVKGAAEKEGARLVMLGGLRGQAPDHSIYLPQPETQYLKCGFFWVER